MLAKFFMAFLANLRNELSTVAFRVLLGAIIASVVVFSIVQLGLALPPLLLPFDYGYQIALWGFAICAVGGLGLLYLLFRQQRLQPPEVANVQVISPEINLPALAVKFAEGLIEGFSPSLFPRQKRLEK